MSSLLLDKRLIFGLCFLSEPFFPFSVTVICISSHSSFAPKIASPSSEGELISAKVLNKSIETAQKQSLRQYTGSDSRIGRCSGGTLILGQAKPAPKKLNLKGWAMQADPKSSGYPPPTEPIFESRSV